MKAAEGYLNTSQEKFAEAAAEAKEAGFVLELSDGDSATLRRPKQFAWKEFIWYSLGSGGFFAVFCILYFFLFAKGEIMQIEVGADGKVDQTIQFEW